MLEFFIRLLAGGLNRNRNFMKIFTSLLLLLGLLQAQSSFITKDEYAKMLYNAPRGISCAKCHGEVGEGKIIAAFVEKGRPKTLQTAPIYHLDYTRFEKGVKSSRSIMPKYYLTEREIAALYYYLQSVNRKKESK
jgi:mono/diheme cytochrome c family protein